MTAVHLRTRSAFAIVVVSLIGIIANLWPFLIRPGSPTLGHTSDAPIFFALLIPLMLAVVLAEIADGGMDAKAVALLGVLSAADAVLRPLGAGTAGIEPMFFLLILAGRVFGAGFGFVLGASSMATSALLTAGIGPWLPFQMLAASWVGMGAGLLPKREGLRWRFELALLAVYGVFAALIFGAVMNMSFWPFSTGGEVGISPRLGADWQVNLRHFVAFDLATSLGWDVGRAITTTVLIVIMGRPIMTALRRAARRASFDAAGTFD